MPFRLWIYTALGLLLMLMKEYFCLSQMRIHVPPSVRSGDNVTMSCEYNLEEVPLYSIKWYRNEEEFYRFVPKESPPFRAFKIKHVNVDISRSGSTDVTLLEVSRELTGDYKCEVSADAPFFHTDIKVAPMIVVDVPANGPTLTTEIVNKALIPKRILARCQSPISDPASNITWYINQVKATKDDPRIKISPLERRYDKGTHSTSSKSLLQLTIDNSVFINGAVEIKCEASIFSLWNKFAETIVNEDRFYSNPVGSTSLQSHTDQVIEIITSSKANSHNLHKIRIYTFIMSFFIIIR